ncbi:MAG: ketopantoate reductase family protein [Spirochaetota bacterium]
MKEKISDTNKIKIAIVGNGAIGMLLACFLSTNKNLQITLYAKRDKAVNSINDRGINLISEENRTDYNINCSLTDNLSEDSDYILLCMKATDIKAFSDRMKSLNKNFSNSIFITLQNGMGYHQYLMDNMNFDLLLAGINTYGATRINDNSVKFAGKGKIVIGDLFSLIGSNKSSVLNFINELNYSDINAVYSENIIDEMWKKLCINICINPITALVRRRNSALHKSKYYEPLMMKLCDEALKVAKAEGISLDYKESLHLIKDIVERTQENKSSMLQDVENNKALEIDYITGYVINLGKKHNIDTTANEIIYNLINIMNGK